MVAEGEIRFKRRKVTAVERGQLGPQFCSLEALLVEGLEGMMLPLEDVGMARKDLPYFLRDTGIHALQVDFARALSQQEWEDDEDDEAAESASAGPANSRLAAPRREPAFENMCGSTFVYGFHVSPSSAPPVALPGPIARCPLSRRYVQQQPPQMSGSSCLRVFSVHGNLLLRMQAAGTMVNFKVGPP